jgi:hypothetical protein
MNEGSALLGFLLVVGLVMHFGWPAAVLLGVPLMIDLVIGHGIRWGRGFRFRPPIEQGLEQASHGFALMVFALLLAVVPYVWLHGWPAFWALAPWFIAHPEKAWPVALFGFAFIVGFVLFRAGARRTAGMRDDIRRPMGVLRVIGGGAVVGYLTWTYPWGTLAAQLPALLLILIAYAGGLWFLLVGLMRVLLLSWPRGQAEDWTEEYIRKTEFSWEPRRRRWWQFWKGRDE